MGVLKAAFLFLRALVIPKFVLAMENLALRQQVAVFKQSVKRPKLRPRDRLSVRCGVSRDPRFLSAPDVETPRFMTPSALFSDHGSRPHRQRRAHFTPAFSVRTLVFDTPGKLWPVWRAPLWKRGITSNLHHVSGHYGSDEFRGLPHPAQ